MRELQNLIDDICHILNEESFSGSSDIQQLADQYRDHVLEINRRLRYCSDLLNKGFRTEVVHEAERSPNLLDTFALLDFLDLDRFKNLLLDLELKPVPSLLIDIACEVNACYSEADRLRPLLKQFRIASLSRASLKVRLSLLRQLCVCDDTNLGWREDLKQYEQQRLIQIQNEILVAKDSKDIEKLKDLSEELSSPVWIELPSPSILETLEGYLHRLNESKSISKLTDIYPHLETAFKDQNVEECSNIMRTVETILKSFPNSLDTKWRETFHKVKRFLLDETKRIQDEKEYQLRINQLSDLLRDQSPLNEIETVTSEIFRIGKSVPKDLNNRVEELKMRMKNEKSRRFISLIMASVFSFILIGSFILMTYRSKDRAKRVSNYESNLSKYLESERYDDAELEIDWLEKEDPYVLKSPSIQNLIVEIKSAIDENEKRIFKFNSIIKQIKTLFLDSNITFDDTNKISDLIVEAEKSAKQPEELAQIENLKAELISSRSQIQSDLDNMFLTELDKLKIRSETKNQNLDELKGLKDEVVSIQSNSSNVSQELKKLVTPLLNQVESDIELMEIDLREETNFDTLTQNLTSIDKYIRSLNRFIELHPDSMTSSSMKKLIESDSEIWLDVEKFSRLQEELMNDKVSDLTVLKATKYLDEWNKLENRLSYHPSIKEKPEMYLTLSKISKRGTEIDDSLIARIMSDEYLGHPLFQKAMYMCDKNQNVYYISEKPIRNKSFENYTINLYVDTEMRRTQIFGIADFNLDLDRSSPPAWLNPIREITDKYTDPIPNPDGVSWDDLVGSLILELQGSKKIEDFQKLRCLSMIIPIAIEGSLILETVLKEHQELISKSSMNFDINWANPRSLEVSLSKEKSSKILKMLPNVDQTRLKLKTRIKEQMNSSPSVGTLYAPSGILRQDKDQWRVLKAFSGKELDGELFIIESNANDLAITRVGNKAGNRIEIDENKSELLSEYKVVWCIKKT